MNVIIYVNYSCILLLCCLLSTTLILILTSMLVMADEFKDLPIYMQEASSVLAHKKLHRTIFICGVISLMSFTSIIGICVCNINIRNNDYPKYEKLQTKMNNSTDTAIGLNSILLAFLEASFHNGRAKEENNNEMVRKSEDYGFYK